MICSDSQLLLKAIANTFNETYDIRANLALVRSELVLQWVPGHTDVPGNEAADRTDKEAAIITDVPPWSVSLANAVSCVNRSTDWALQDHNSVQIHHLCRG